MIVSETMSPRPLSGWLKPGEIPAIPTLTVVWCREEPHRVGEILQIPDGTWSIGRSAVSGSPRLLLPVRQRPGLLEPRPAFGSPRISRVQWLVTAGAQIEVQNVGRCPLLVNGRSPTSGRIHPGDVLEIENEILFLLSLRPALIPPPSREGVLHPFGEVDSLGLMGESPVIWAIRHQIHQVARLGGHVLVTGPSGAGKERVALAIHQLSPRSLHPAVARNVATLPESLVESELFGNVKGYPQVGMASRPGLVGEAHQSTLILDELGELPESAQARLLRVMDSGEYHTLGDAQVRLADLRVVAMTNRPERVKHDVIGRFVTHIQVPGLEARREDIPLLASALARRHHLALHPTQDGAVLLSPRLVEALVNHRWTTHIRELDGLLLKATLEGQGRYLDLTPGVQVMLNAASAPTEAIIHQHHRLDLLREHQFSPARCGADPRYPGNRQTADLHIRILMAETLLDNENDIVKAAASLAGSAKGPTFDRMCGRMEVFTQRIQVRVREAIQSGSLADLRERILEEYKGQGEKVWRVGLSLSGLTHSE